MTVPRFDPVRADAPQREAIRAGIDRVLESGQFVGGAEVEQFERELAASLKVPCVVSCASGTDALTLGLLGLRSVLAASPGDPPPVVVPALSFSATASAVVRAGCRPVFVDVEPDTLLMDWGAAADVEDALAVVPVHLYGRVCRPPVGWGGGVAVLEDACQAFGAWSTVGHLGEAAAFSFFPSKPLGCYGDGGALACSVVVGDHVRALARHGREGRRYVSEHVGFNSRLDAVQAAVLRAKLPAVEDHRRRREQIATTYAEQLSDDGRTWLRLPQLVPDHAWHCYAVRLLDGSRDDFLHHARGRGVDVAVQYPVPLHQMPAFRGTSQRVLRTAEEACGQLACLPIWSGMTDSDVDAVVDAVRSF